jgi:hypothetical protein
VVGIQATLLIIENIEFNLPDTLVLKLFRQQRV